MSTCYATVGTPIPFDKFLAAIPILGLKIVPTDQETDTYKCIQLPNGDYVHAYTGNGADTGFTRYGWNDPDDGLADIAEHFGTIIVSEHDPNYPWESNEDEDEDEDAPN